MPDMACVLNVFICWKSFRSLVLEQYFHLIACRTIHLSIIYLDVLWLFVSLPYFLLRFPVTSSVCNSFAFSSEQSSHCCPLSPALAIWNMNINLQGESLLLAGSVLYCYYIRDYLVVEPQITIFWQFSCVSNELSQISSLSMSPCIH